VIILFDKHTGKALHRIEAESLVGVRLFDLALEGVNLVEAFLHGADFTLSGLDSADLARASCKNAWLYFTHFRSANFEGACLNSTHIEDCILRDARLLSIEFVFGNCLESSFVNADLRGANLRGTVFRRCNFRNPDLSGATLEDTQYIECYGL
jgi:uncharacterized protein YjbI with pentapeptide repeats